jgi:hypothetical protein
MRTEEFKSAKRASARAAMAYRAVRIDAFNNSHKRQKADRQAREAAELKAKK